MAALLLSASQRGRVEKKVLLQYSIEKMQKCSNCPNPAQHLHAVPKYNIVCILILLDVYRWETAQQQYRISVNHGVESSSTTFGCI